MDEDPVSLSACCPQPSNFGRMRRSRLVYLGIIAAIALVVTCGVCPAFSQQPWHLETVQTTGSTDYESLAMDWMDESHVSFYIYETQDLGYVRTLNGVWLPPEYPDLTGDVGSLSSLALDHQGQPHIVYFDRTQLAIKYARNIGDLWIVESIAPTGGDNWTAYNPKFLALDRQGTPHIVYYNETTHSLMYGCRRNGTWEFEVLCSTGLPRGGWSIVVDETERPHVAYCLENPSVLRYAVRENGVWQDELVDGDNYGVLRPSLCLDQHGAPRIAYERGNFNPIKYAEKIGDTWTIVQAGGGPSHNPSLAIDAAGSPHVTAYFIWGGQNRLIHWWRSGESWSHEDVVFNEMYRSSLAADRHGGLRVAGGGSNGVKFAWRSDPSLRAHWTFDEGAGSVAYDHSGNGNDATLHGPTWVPGASGSALSFDGLDDYAQAVTINAPRITVAAWVNVSQFFEDDAGRAIVSNGHYYTDQGYMLYEATSLPYNRGQAFITTSDGRFAIDAAQQLLNVNEWYHLAMTYDGTTFSLYVNGVPDTTIPASGEINPASQALLLGATYWPTGAKFAGILDEVRVYDRALSPEGVAELAQAITPSLVAHWSFDEGSGNTAGDGSPNQHDGIINGAGWVPGVSGTALEFDGDDFVDVGSGLVLPTNPSAFSIAAWIRTTHDSGTIFVQTTPGQTGSDVNHHLMAAHFDEYPPNGGGSSFMAPLLDGQWHHVAVVVDDGTRQLYVDGLPDALGPQEIYGGANPEATRIGDRNGWLPELYAFVGTIDDVRIYDRDLSSEQMRDLYLALADPLVTLVTPDVADPLTPTEQAISWTHGGPAPHHWDVSYALGNVFSPIATELPGSATACVWTPPPAGTTHLRFRVQGFASDGTLLGEDVSDVGVVVWNPVGVAFEYHRPGETESESRAVIVWDEVSGAYQYRVTLTQLDATACWDTPGFPRTFELEPDPTGLLATYFELPSPDWETMAPAKWAATVRAYDENGGLLSPEQIEPFLKVRLGDLDPYDTESKLPVILVHGWTSDASEWFENDQCPLKNMLVAGDGEPAHGRHPWTLEYPNIGGIAESGAGIGEAIRYIRHLSGHDTTQLVTHSMGGLVSRTYLQGLARAPSDGSLYPTFRGDVDRCVTLSTPHLGEPFTGSAAWVVNFTCDGARRSQSFRDLDEDSQLIASLATASLPAIESFFSAGTDYHGEPGGGTVRRRVLNDICGYGNDATVDVCSARGGDCEGLHRHRHLNFGGATIVRATYDLAHGRMSKPGTEFGGQRRTQESTRLLNDVVGFLRCGTCLESAQCPAYAPTPIEVNVRVREQLPEDRPQQSRSLEPLAHRRLGASAAIGASVRIRSVESQDSSDGLLFTTDAAGRATMELLPEGSIIDVFGPGVISRSDTLDAHSVGGNVNWTLDVAIDPAYIGPRNPRLSINEGAECAVDSLVTLELSCEGATEFQVSSSPAFEGAQWVPLIPAAPFALPDGPGRNVLYARYRDSEGRESSTVWSSIIYGPDALGELVVESSIPGARIILNGRDSGRLSPTTFDALVPGFYYVSAALPGSVFSPGQIVVRADGSEPVQVVFSAAPSMQPEPVDLRTLGETEFLSGRPFQWSPVADPDSNDVVFYDVRVSVDSMQTEPLWTRLGVTQASVSLDSALPDSLVYFISLRSIDGHGASATDSPGSRRFSLDDTAPSLSIERPSEGDILFGGNAACLRSTAADWGRLQLLTATLSSDGGTSFPDTIYQGPWADSVAFTVPVDISSDRCIIDAVLKDAAENSTHAYSTGFFTIRPSPSGLGDGNHVPAAFSLSVCDLGCSTVRLRFGVPGRARASINIFDVGGRLVRPLLDEIVNPGGHEIVWTGDGSGGARLPSGVYWAVLTSQGNRAVRRVLLLR